MNPRYPIYIISKGRYDLNFTAKTLDYMNVPYFLVVEPQEYTKYAAVINSRKIIVTPFSNLGQGSIPVRNFVWDLAIKAGVKRYWIMDDNIKYFFRLNNHMKIPVSDGTILRCMEDFVDRYENIALAGPQYFYFASRKSKNNPFTINTRIYSHILIKTDLDFKWRGKYNEDTDLSIRVLKAGHCTLLFNSFLSGKVPTLSNKGGNASIYNKTTERKEFAEALQKQHPKLVKIVRRYNRWHHEVDYSPFKNNELILKPGIKIKPGIDNYGMELLELKNYNKIFSL